MGLHSKTSRYLRIKRIEAGLSQADLGRKLKLHPQFVSNWERGLCSPPDKSLKKMCRFLNIDQKEFLEILLADARVYFKSILNTKKSESK